MSAELWNKLTYAGKRADSAEEMNETEDYWATAAHNTIAIGNLQSPYNQLTVIDRY